MKLIIVLALALAVLAACGDDGGDTADATTTTSEPATSVEQVASIVAEARPDMVEAIEGGEGCFFMEELNRTTCVSRIVTLGHLSAALITDLEQVDDVPDEVADLVRRTIAAAQKAEAAGGDVDTACQPEGPECEQAIVAWDLAYSDIDDVLAAWEPYL